MGWEARICRAVARWFECLTGSPYHEGSSFTANRRNRGWRTQPRATPAERRKISGVAAEVPKPREGILSQSETQYQLLFDGNPVPMWMFERETLKFLDVNEAAIRHYGFSKEEFLSMTIADIRPAEDVERLLEHVAVAIHGLQEAELWRHRKKDGTIIDVEIVSHNMDFHGTPAELVAAHDVTRRMQTEEALRKAEEKYRTIFENAVSESCGEP